jgi:hypothetical protein
MSSSNKSWLFISMASVMVLALLSLPYLLFVARRFEKRTFEENSVRLLTDFRATKIDDDMFTIKSLHGATITTVNDKDRIFKFTWADGSSILTRFSEECCGDRYDAHIIKSSTATIYVTDGIHYCGLEGMGSALGDFPNEAEFIKHVVEKGAHVANQH